MVELDVMEKKYLDQKLCFCKCYHRFDDIINLVSHDLRGSLRALSELPEWIAEDLRAEGVDADGCVGRTIDLMNRHTGRLDRMLTDFLCFSRLGRMQETRIMNMKEVFGSVIAEIDIPSGFEIRSKFDYTNIRIGERDIHTLLNALVMNSLRHHDRKFGIICVTMTDEGGFLRIAVIDDGPGIESHYSEKVFGLLTTLRPKDEIEGSGMGLAIVRRIAQIYGGNAWIEPLELKRGLQLVVTVQQ
jgi:light-regulated signal transduction histidine kinase (bacteriophytochrome)